MVEELPTDLQETFIELNEEISNKVAKVTYLNDKFGANIFGKYVEHQEDPEKFEALDPEEQKTITRNHSIDFPAWLDNIMISTKKQLYEHMYHRVYEYLQRNKPKDLDAIVAKYEHNKTPTSCFVNVYPPGVLSGTCNHVDHVQYAACTIGIFESDEDGEAGPLCIRMASSQYFNRYPLPAFRYVVYGRAKHAVPVIVRQYYRATMTLMW